jgi:hypothetical protein
MASIVVRAPDGSIVEIPEAQYQDALNQGYSNVPQAEAEAARDEAVAGMDPGEAVSRGLLEAPDDYSRGDAGREKILLRSTPRPENPRGPGAGHPVLERASLSIDVR